MSLVYGNPLSKTPVPYSRVQPQPVMSLLELPRNPTALPAPSSQHCCFQAKASEGVPTATPEFMLDEPGDPGRMGRECGKSDGQDLRKPSPQRYSTKGLLQ